MLHYCKRCGRLYQRFSDDEKKCDFCNYIVQPVPVEYLDEECDIILIPERKQEFMDKYIWSSLEFDPELHKKMKHWLDIRWDKKTNEKPGNPYGIECPYCHSTYIERISGMTVSVFTDVSAVGKQFKCQHCSAYF